MEIFQEGKGVYLPALCGRDPDWTLIGKLLVTRLLQASLTKGQGHYPGIHFAQAIKCMFLPCDHRGAYRAALYWVRHTVSHCSILMGVLGNPKIIKPAGSPKDGQIKTLSPNGKISTQKGQAVALWAGNSTIWVLPATESPFLHPY